MRDPLDELYEEALAAFRARQWRSEHTYVVDLIEILRPYGNPGASRGAVLRALLRLRLKYGLPIPETFEATVQSAFNQHCVDSAVFRKRHVSGDGLFSSRRIGSTATWVVLPAPATAWLIARNQTNVPPGGGRALSGNIPAAGVVHDRP